MKKTIVVTGSSTGFGKLAVQTLAKDGHKVFATMRGIDAKNKSFADDIKKWSTENNTDVHVVEMDVASDISVNEAAKTILAVTDKIDVVVNNAGIYASGLSEGFTVENYKSLYEVNVFGIVRVVHAFLPAMRKQKSGLFIHVSSLMGRFVIPFNSVYTSSKWAVEAIAESLRYELAPMGIDSVVVQPGPFPTEIFSKTTHGQNEAVTGEYTQTLPYIQAFGQAFTNMMAGEVPNKPQDVADAIKSLVDTPAGQRPLRVAVDKMMPGNAQPINEAQEKVQEGFLGYMGLKDLMVTAS